MRLGVPAGWIVAALALSACSSGDEAKTPESPSEPVAASASPGAGEASGAGGPAFVDRTSGSGVDFVHETGARGKKWLPETMGSGVVVFDFDGDDRLDLLFPNGSFLEGDPGPATQKLYRNLGGFRFEDVTAETGLDFTAYCLGGTAADIDADGDDDLYLTCLGTDRLLMNDGGRFRDESAERGLSREYEFGSGATFFDADRDGDLDLFAARYVTWTPESDLFCTLDGEAKSYCTPEPYDGASPRFYRNRGDGTFEDATREAGFFVPTAKSLGVTTLDIDGNGALDVMTANDTQPNLLFQNRGDGTFEEVGVLSGTAFSETGVARGGMGVDAADYDGSGRPSIAIGNFANEMVALYHNEGNLLFVDVAPQARIGRPTLLSLTFGTFFFDYDLDGELDLLIANGHLDPDIERVQPNVRYAQPTQLFRNLGNGAFEEVTGEAAGALATPRVARGAAWGDLDGDGDPDVVLTTNGGPAALLENRAGDGGNWLRVDLEPDGSAPGGIGAEIVAEVGDRRLRRRVTTGGSYLSQSQVEPLIGLGERETVDRLTVEWPRGASTSVEAVPARSRQRLSEAETPDLTPDESVP